MRLLPLLKRQLRLPEPNLKWHHPRHNRAIPKACAHRANSLVTEFACFRMFTSSVPSGLLCDHIAPHWPPTQMNTPCKAAPRSAGTRCTMHACMQGRRQGAPCRHSFSSPESTLTWRLRCHRAGVHGPKRDPGRMNDWRSRANIHKPPALPLSLPPDMIVQSGS